MEGKQRLQNIVSKKIAQKQKMLLTVTEINQEFRMVL